MQQSLTFPCPECGRRMGVGLDLIGRPVRCPGCRQIVIAPSAGHPAGRPADPGSVAPEAHAPTPAPTDYQPPAFQAPPKEGVDSIFGETEADEDSVFGVAKPPPVLRNGDPDLLQPTDRLVRTPELLAPAPKPPEPAPPADPWVGMLAESPPPPPGPLLPDPVPPRADRRNLLIYGLGAYSAAMTGLAAWGWLRRR